MTNLAHLRRLLPSRDRAVPAENQALGRIGDVAGDLRGKSDRQLRQLADRLRQVSPGEPGRKVSRDRASSLVPLYGLVVEAIRRTLGYRVYEVQLLAGIALAGRTVVEMRTGEGKTLVAAFPACLRALDGDPVHVMTTNSYLARRDCEQLLPAYRMLGFSAGVIDSAMSPREKTSAYRCDVTYGPGYEFGFDYLRDQSALLAARERRLGDDFRDRSRNGVGRPATTQRGHGLAIVDEVDSVLLDEATTPLILTSRSPAPGPDAAACHAARSCIRDLVEGRDYVIDPSVASARLTEQGTRLASNWYDIPRRCLRRGWPAYVEQALKAELLIRRDVDYVVDSQGSVLIVDQVTGRIHADRAWRDGLQQAVQAKEGLGITAEAQPLARITRQRFFRRYERICGMTGTAGGGEREFRQSYRTDVVVVPPRKPCRLRILPMRAFASIQAKYRAVIREIEDVHRLGRPVLVGTTTIRDSRLVSRGLRERGVPLRLLNGLQDEDEARIVARAGEVGAVTIATNMAGRGTDIRLAPGVADIGGLYVIAWEPQESPRVDRQLLGRAARQGDPGCGRVFVSADDPLILRHSPALSRRMERLPRDPEDEILQDLSRDVTRLQRRVERLNHARRQRMFLHEDWIETTLDTLAK